MTTIQMRIKTTGDDQSPVVQLVAVFFFSFFFFLVSFFLFFSFSFFVGMIWPDVSDFRLFFCDVYCYVCSRIYYSCLCLTCPIISCSGWFVKGKNKGESYFFFSLTQQGDLRLIVDFSIFYIVFP